MKTTGKFAKGAAWLICGGVVLTSLTGCKPDEKHKPPGGGVTGTLFDLGDAIGAVVFGKDGRIIVVDAKGQPVPPCALPGREPAPGQAGVCQKVTNTAIIDLKSIGAARHTGSECILLEVPSGGQAVDAGGLFQLPPGCP
jgi:hypothetical protein